MPKNLTRKILEVLGLDLVRVDPAAWYVDHNLLQSDFKNDDDHRYSVQTDPG
jgi:aconitate hydratase